MLDFMVIALPRSGTTWAANWLITDATFCAHDPLWTVHYTDFDTAIKAKAGGRLAGISCTAIWRWPQWLAKHPARKLILHRDINEVRGALTAANIPLVERAAADQIAALDGRHIEWSDLFDPARAEKIWDWLTAGLPFDKARHAELVQLKIEPQQNAVKRDLALNARIADELGVRPVNQSMNLEIRVG